MILQRKLIKKAARLSNRLWFERVMAIVTVLNLSLVAFDLSYLPWRDFYLRTFPAFTQWYGASSDRFWQLDLAFTALFALELCARTFALSRIDKVSWLDALLWRWYDLLLLLPFWRWLRIIPVLVRLNQSRLVNLNSLSDRFVKSLVTHVGIELTEVVVLRVIDQIQDLIRQGEISRWLLQSAAQQRYIDLNNIDEGKAIAQHLVTLLAYQVLPEIKPDLEALVHHSLTRVLSASPAYSSLGKLPGLGDWSNQMTQQIVAQVSQNSYQALIDSLEDPVGIDLLQRLIDRFTASLKTQAKQGAATEIQTLLVDLLEEVKINYVKRLTEADPELLKADRKKLYGMTRRGL
jgi:hypothetical protein